MTNEVTAAVGSFVIRDTLPIPGLTLWIASLVLMPVIALYAFVMHGRMARRNKDSYWHPRIILLAALMVATLTALQLSARLQLLFLMGGMIKCGESQRAIASITLSHCCWVFSLGLLATVFCLALRLMLPKAKIEGDRQPSAAPLPSAQQMGPTEGVR